LHDYGVPIYFQNDPEDPHPPEGYPEDLHAPERESEDPPIRGRFRRQSPTCIWEILTNGDF
jgi:hypothetical protein